MGMTPQYFAVSSVYTDQLVPGKGAVFQTFSTWHPNTFCPYCIYLPSTAFYWPSTTKYQSDCLMTGAVFMILFIKNHIIWFPSVQHCNWFEFRISLSLSREGAIFRDEIENIFLALAWRDEIEIIIWPFSYFETRTRFHFVTLMFRDKIETSENHFSWSSEKKWSWLSSRIPGIENSRWPLITSLSTALSRW